MICITPILLVFNFLVDSSAVSNFYTLSLCTAVSSLPVIVPVKNYYNADTQKTVIVEENNYKAGIYRWVNNINGKTYVGSSINLKQRFLAYFNYSYLSLFQNNSLIYKSLLKYGHSNFSLEILEYCDKDILITREQYYLNTLKPEYNVLKIARSSLGFKHSTETLENLSKNNYKSIKLTATNVLTQETFNFNSMKDAARQLSVLEGVTKSAMEGRINRYFTKGILVLDKYKFEKINGQDLVLIEKYKQSAESIALKVKNDPFAIQLKITNIFTQEIFIYRSLLEAARELSVKENITYQSARYLLEKDLKNDSLFLNKYQLQKIKG